MNTTLKNLHVFRVIYLPHSATLPARVKIISERFKQSITVSYHADGFEDCRDAQEVAVKHLTSLGYNITSIGEGWGCMYVISDTFKPLK